MCLWALFTVTLLCSQNEKVFPRSYVFGNCDSIYSNSSEINNCSNIQLAKYITKIFKWDKITKSAPYKTRLLFSFEIDPQGSLHFIAVKNRQHPYDSLTLSIALEEAIKLEPILNSSNSIKPFLNKEGHPSIYKGTLFFYSDSGYFINEEVIEKTKIIERNSAYKSIYAISFQKDFLLFYKSTTDKKIAVYQLNSNTKEQNLLKIYNTIEEASLYYSYLKNLSYRNDYPISYGYRGKTLVEIRKINTLYKTYYFFNETKKEYDTFENELSLFYSIYKPMVLK